MSHSLAQSAKQDIAPQQTISDPFWTGGHPVERMVGNFQYPLYRDRRTNRAVLPLGDLIHEPDSTVVCAEWPSGEQALPLRSDLATIPPADQPSKKGVLTAATAWAKASQPSVAYWLGCHHERHGNQVRAFWYQLAAIRQNRPHRQFWSMTLTNTISMIDRPPTDIRFLWTLPEIVTRTFSNDWQAAISAAEAAKTVLAGPRQIAHAKRILAGRETAEDRRKIDFMAPYPGAKAGVSLAAFAAGFSYGRFSPEIEEPAQPGDQAERY